MTNNYQCDYSLKDSTFNTTIDLLDDLICKAFRFVYYSAESSTQVLLVVFTMNRVVAIGWPLAAKTILSNHSTLITIGEKSYSKIIIQHNK